MRYADMHCDTLTELYGSGHDIENAPLHVNLANTTGLSPYIQTAAVWTDKRLTDDEAYTRFFQVTDSFRQSPSYKRGLVRMCRTKSELDSAVSDGIPAFVLSVEGARLLGGDMARFDSVIGEGVRLVTLQWSGSDCIGGAWDTDMPLTDFGKSLLPKMAECRIAADISHAGIRTSEQVLDASAKLGLTVCASHSNSIDVCSHKRNLTDEMFIQIRDVGGIVGLSMAPEHLNDSGMATVSDVCRHLYRYLELGGENTVCLGCDFDGIGTTPEGINGIGDIPRLKEALLREGFPANVLDRVFFDNAYRFIRRILADG